MTSDRNDVRYRTSALAADLLDAFGGGQPIAGVEAPETAAEAYAVQRLVAGRRGRVRGWKVGRTDPSAPITCGPVLDTMAFDSGVTLPRASQRLWLVEAELVFRFGRDLPPRERPYTQAEVRNAIADVRPGIELVDSRLAGWAEAPPLLKLADLQSHGALILGAPASALPPEPWHRRTLRLTVGGTSVVDGEAANPAGDLLDLMTLLADHLAATAGGLRAGDLVTTGSFSGATPLAAGATAEAAFDGMGAVSLASGP